MERSNWRWCQCFVTVFLPLSEWRLLSTAAPKIRLQISHLLMVFCQVEKAALDERCAITETGERMTLISPTNVPVENVATCMQQDSGLAEPCSLTLQRGGVGCEELNPAERRQERRWHSARPVQKQTIELHRMTFISFKKCGKPF